MIRFEHTEVVGWKAAIRGMRNPMNSWDKSDTDYNFADCNTCLHANKKACDMTKDCIIIGPNDLNLMQNLCKAGTDHRKFMRMITVYVDITAPLYWWKEFDTYKVGTVANSCSTMHKIHAKKFTTDDFSLEHVDDDIIDQPFTKILDCLNVFRNLYLLNKDKEDFTVTKKDGMYVEEGEAIEKLLRRVNMEDNESLYYFQKSIKNLGVEERLKAMGIKEGYTVKFIIWEFEWYN